MIRWFGTRGKLFNVHFRNIRGRKLDFMEAFPTRATWTWRASLRVYREVGYQYMLMPDHVPEIDGRDPSGTAFAFCYGYSRPHGRDGSLRGGGLGLNTPPTGVGRKIRAPGAPATANLTGSRRSGPMRYAI